MRPSRLLVPMLLALAAGPLAAEQFVYPAKKQSPEQQRKDEAECGAWAVDKSHFDPAVPPQAAPVAQPAPVAGSGARVRGAAVGATVGAVTGGDAGDAAVAGAVVGAHKQRRRNRQAADQANQAQAEQRAQAEASYWNARAACLQGRGYSVK